LALHSGSIWEAGGLLFPTLVTGKPLKRLMLDDPPRHLHNDALDARYLMLDVDKQLIGSQ
jgi:hypothetical protein